MMHLSYRGLERDLPDSITDSQLVEALKDAFPEVATATVVHNGNQVTFEVRAGNKGATIHLSYRGLERDLPDNLTNEQIIDALKDAFPEVATATVVRENGRMTFEVRAGNKGN